MTSIQYARSSQSACVFIVRLAEPPPMPQLSVPAVARGISAVDWLAHAQYFGPRERHSALLGRAAGLVIARPVVCWSCDRAPVGGLLIVVIALRAIQCVSAVTLWFP